MKPGGPLKRKKPFLSARSPMARSSRLTRTRMAAKRRERTPEEAHARKLLTARSGRVCEMCGSAPATDAHHRVNRSQGGRWEITNLLHLCHEHHMHVTVNPALAKSRGWSVARHNNPAVVPVWLAGRDWSLLDADGGVTPYNGKAA